MKEATVDDLIVQFRGRTEAQSASGSALPDVSFVYDVCFPSHTVVVSILYSEELCEPGDAFYDISIQAGGECVGLLDTHRATGAAIQAHKSWAHGADLHSTRD